MLDDAATGAFTYTADNDYVGSDRFSFRGSDGSGTSNTAEVSITITAAPGGGGSGSGSSSGGGCGIGATASGRPVLASCTYCPLFFGGGEKTSTGVPSA